MDKVTIHVSHELDKELLSKWQSLWDSSEEGNFHNSPKWFQSCLEGLGLQSYYIVTATHGEQLEAVFPLVWEKRFGIKVLCNPGERFTDKSTLLLRKKDPKVIKALMEELMKLGNLYLEEMSEELADLFCRAEKSVKKQKASINPYLPLLPDPLRLMTNKMRNKITNRIKRHEKQLSFITYKGDPKGLSEAFKLDAKSTKRQQGKSDLAGEREKKFMETLLSVHKEQFTVDFLCYEKMPMVYTIGLEYKKTYHAFQTAYDGTYSQMSPGKMLNFYIYDRLVKEGFELFDYSRGTNHLKREFSNLEEIQYKILYSQSFLILRWWEMCDFLYHFILNNKLLYGTYLFFKKLILYR